MQEQSFDPSKPARMKLQVSPAPAPAPDPEAQKALIAERVRADSKERRGLTPEHVVQKLAPGLPLERLRELLFGMAADERYGDIKGVVAPSGRVYLFSTLHLAAAEALRRGRIEEAKLAIAEFIRTDSRKLSLTPAADLEALYPSGDPAERVALLAELEADERLKDVQRLAGPDGETYYHSERHLTGAYGQILLRARTQDPCFGIAELVRDRSRTLPKPTRITVFEDPVFRIDPARLEEKVAELLASAEYADIKKLVHPETGGVYLYSNRWLEEQQAFLIMDWDEVGAARNP